MGLVAVGNRRVKTIGLSSADTCGINAAAAPNKILFMFMWVEISKTSIKKKGNTLLLLLSLPVSLSEQISHGAHQLTPLFESLLLLGAQSMKGHIGNTTVLHGSK